MPDPGWRSCGPLPSPPGWADHFSVALRTVSHCRYPDASWHPGMLAVVTAPDGTLANVHRTYLTPDGDKAPVAQPRMFMPGKVQAGSAVRLFSYQIVWALLKASRLPSLQHSFLVSLAGRL